MNAGSWQFNGVSWLYVASALVALLTAYQSWKMRPVRGAKEFTLLSVSLMVWSIGYFLGFFNSDLAWKLVFLRLEYLGIISSSYFWFLFAVTYTESESLRKPKSLAYFAILPAVSFILVLTVTQNHLFYSSYGTEQAGGLVVLQKSYAIGFYIQTVYSYFLVLSGMLLLLNSVYQMPNQLRYQILPITLAVLLILLPNIFYIAKARIFGVYDPTPISFAMAGVVINLMMARYRFLDIAPTAYNQVLRSIDSGIVIIDDRQRILELNPASERILSVSLENVIGKTLQEVCHECSDITSGLGELSEKREIQIGKEKRIYSVSFSPFRNGGGKSMGGIVLFYDITDLRYALDEIDTFAHTVAHDLKTPLSLLAGFSDILSSDGLTEAERADAVGVIRSYSGKMLSIVDELLMLARVRRQKDIRFEALEMSAVVNSAILRLERFSQERKGKIFQPDHWPVAVGYAPWVEEVWVNYISNALKYGGPSPTVYLGAERVEKQVKFWVKDRGIGLSDKEQALLFKEFSRLRREGDETGHGLGLFTVDRIVKRLGGEAGVESEIGSGSKFYFTLPIAED